MTNNEIDNNGYEYVNLVLPNHTLWATANVGASKPSEPGLYFQWGDVKGYEKNQIETGDCKKNFSYEDYKWNPNGDEHTLTKYIAPKGTLALEDDAANVNMGGSWHIPSPKQIKELVDNTTSEWTTQDGVNGRLFTSKKDKSKSIFIPAVGRAWGSIIEGDENIASIWSNYNQFLRSAKCLYFTSNYSLVDNLYNCYLGLQVRGVIG